MATARTSVTASAELLWCCWPMTVEKPKTCPGVSSTATVMGSGRDEAWTVRWTDPDRSTKAQSDDSSGEKMIPPGA
jgi:hypothetical protein